MANVVMPKKAKTIRIWFWVVMLCLVGLFITMKYTVLGKNNIINGFIGNCAQSTPASDNWQADLKRFGYEGDTSWLPQPYCECMLFPVFEPMTEVEIRQFADLPAPERLQKMGGNEGMQQRHEQCLKQYLPPKAS